MALTAPKVRMNPITGSPAHLVLSIIVKPLKLSSLLDFRVSLTGARKAPNKKHLHAPCTKCAGDPMNRRAYRTR